MVQDKEALSGSLGSGKKLGCCIVGLGRAGHFHLESMKALRELCELRWVVDTDTAKAAKIAASFGCKYSASLPDALADKECEAIIIASTTDTHYGYIVESLRAKKAVFTEKPISHDPRELKECVDLAIQSNLPFVVGYQRRVDKNFRELKRRLDCGEVGALRLIKSCSRDNPLPPLSYLKTSGGIFHDMLCHDFDVIHWLSNGQIPESVLSYGHCYNDDIRKMGDVDSVAVMMKFPSGLIAMVDTCREAAYGYDQRVEVFGDKGMARAENAHNDTVEVATQSGFLRPPAEWSFPERYKQAYAVEMAEFVALVRNSPGPALVHEQRSCRRHPDIDRITAAAELSYHLGRQVYLKDLDKLRAEHASKAKL
eukprot:Hpha_TRINITY_DN13131_c0_g1::TRINITY_DN13131_c0_g1_i1::g.113811::m.113811/K00010/iolG; myo-inositol 2-dehydrogenase / D-chiro-inositol 1-dehydrogenase